MKARPEGERLLTFEQAMAFLRDCEATRARLLGIDRVVVLGSDVLPDMGGILDLTSGAEDIPSEQALAASRRFLSRFGSDGRERFVVTVGE